jgi:hypothetical protein
MVISRRRNDSVPVIKARAALKTNGFEKVLKS